MNNKTFWWAQHHAPLITTLVFPFFALILMGHTPQPAQQMAAGSVALIGIFLLLSSIVSLPNDPNLGTDKDITEVRIVGLIGAALLIGFYGMLISANQIRLAGTASGDLDPIFHTRMLAGGSALVYMFGFIAAWRIRGRYRLQIEARG